MKRLLWWLRWAWSGPTVREEAHLQARFRILKRREEGHHFHAPTVARIQRRWLVAELIQRLEKELGV